METTRPTLPARKLLEQSETRELGANGERKYIRTNVVFTDGKTIYKAQTSYRLREIESHLDELEGVPVALEQICPNVDKGQFIQVTNPMPVDCYVKTPRIAMWSEENYHMVRGLVLQEARVCELLMKNPHPNVSKYLGCKLDGSLITGLCFERYEEDLYDRVNDKGMEGLSVDSILQGIRSGIEHIHNLGYCHNDISPFNIMLRSDNTPVIIDFDTCRPTNMKLGDKAGAFGFSESSVKYSKPEKDFYGLKRIEECLRRGDFCSI